VACNGRTTRVCGGFGSHCSCKIHQVRHFFDISAPHKGIAYQQAIFRRSAKRETGPAPSERPTGNSIQCRIQKKGRKEFPSGLFSIMSGENRTECGSFYIDSPCGVANVLARLAAISMSTRSAPKRPDSYLRILSFSRAVSISLSVSSRIFPGSSSK
jgi:hypothetical protein